MQRTSMFLDFRPSLKAAASLLLAFNISQSQIAPDIGLKKIPEDEIRSLLNKTLVMSVPSLDAKKEVVRQQGPLRMWSKSIESLTSLKKQDIKRIYKPLIVLLNQELYGQRLFNDPALFL